MKDKGPLVEGSCGGGLEDAERRSPHSPHGPAAEAIGGAPGIRLAAGREVAGPAADWLRRQAEVMLLSVAPQAPGKPRVSAGRRRRRRRRRRLLRVCSLCSQSALLTVKVIPFLQFHKMNVTWLPRPRPKLHREPSLLF